MLQIALHRGSGLVSRLIRWQQRGEWSHASVILRNGSVIESREFIGVRQLPKLTAAKGEFIQVFNVECTDEQADAIEAFLTKQIGKRYDYPMVFGFVSRSTTEGHESGGKWFCSELAFAAFRAGEINLLARIEPFEVSPPHLAYSPLLMQAYTIQG